MSVVVLRILEPVHNSHHTPDDSFGGKVRLRGEVVPSAVKPMYYKWYSNLKTSTNGLLETQVSLAMPLEMSLSVGSHSIVLAAKDVEDDDMTSLMNVRVAGMAGGAPLSPPHPIISPCVIHVFIANMLIPEPGDENPVLKIHESVLDAEAPTLWCIPDLSKSPRDYTKYDKLNAEYHAVNRIQYRWILAPVKNKTPDNTLSLVPEMTQLTFAVPSDNLDPPEQRYHVSSIRHKGPLQGGKEADRRTIIRPSPGDYTLTLRVEDKQEPNVFHEVSRAVTLID